MLSNQTFGNKAETDVGVSPIRVTRRVFKKTMDVIKMVKPMVPFSRHADSFDTIGAQVFYLESDDDDNWDEDSSICSFAVASVHNQTFKGEQDSDVESGDEEILLNDVLLDSAQLTQKSEMATQEATRGPKKRLVRRPSRTLYFLVDSAGSIRNQLKDVSVSGRNSSQDDAARNEEQASTNCGNFYQDQSIRSKPAISRESSGIIQLSIDPSKTYKISLDDHAADWDFGQSRDSSATTLETSSSVTPRDGPNDLDKPPRKAARRSSFVMQVAIESEEEELQDDKSVRIFERSNGARNVLSDSYVVESASKMDETTSNHEDVRKSKMTSARVHGGRLRLSVDPSRTYRINLDDASTAKATTHLNTMEGSLSGDDDTASLRNRPRRPSLIMFAVDPGDVNEDSDNEAQHDDGSATQTIPVDDASQTNLDGAVGTQSTQLARNRGVGRVSSGTLVLLFNTLKALEDSLSEKASKKGKGNSEDTQVVDSPASCSDRDSGDDAAGSHHGQATAQSISKTQGVDDPVSCPKNLVDISADTGTIPSPDESLSRSRTTTAPLSDTEGSFTVSHHHGEFDPSFPSAKEPSHVNSFCENDQSNGDPGSLLDEREPAKVSDLNQKPDSKRLSGDFEPQDAKISGMLPGTLQPENLTTSAIATEKSLQTSLVWNESRTPVSPKGSTVLLKSEFTIDNNKNSNEDVKGLMSSVDTNEIPKSSLLVDPNEHDVDKSSKESKPISDIIHKAENVNVGKPLRRESNQDPFQKRDRLRLETTSDVVSSPKKAALDAQDLEVSDKQSPAANALKMRDKKEATASSNKSRADAFPLTTSQCAGARANQSKLSLERVSSAFGSDGGMVGYFAKVKDLKQKGQVPDLKQSSKYPISKHTTISDTIVATFEEGKAIEADQLPQLSIVRTLSESNYEGDMFNNKPLARDLKLSPADIFDKPAQYLSGYPLANSAVGGVAVSSRRLRSKQSDSVDPDNIEQSSKHTILNNHRGSPKTDSKKSFPSESTLLQRRRSRRHLLTTEWLSDHTSSYVSTQSGTSDERNVESSRVASPPNAKASTSLSPHLRRRRHVRANTLSQDQSVFPLAVGESLSKACMNEAVALDDNPKNADRRQHHGRDPARKGTDDKAIESRRDGENECKTRRHRRTVVQRSLQGKVRESSAEPVGRSKKIDPEMGLKEPRTSFNGSEKDDVIPDDEALRKRRAHYQKGEIDSKAANALAQNGSIEMGGSNNNKQRTERERVDTDVHRPRRSHASRRSGGKPCDAATGAVGRRKKEKDKKERAHLQGQPCENFDDEELESARPNMSSSSTQRARSKSRKAQSAKGRGSHGDNRPTNHRSSQRSKSQKTWRSRSKRVKRNTSRSLSPQSAVVSALPKSRQFLSRSVSDRNLGMTPSNTETTATTRLSIQNRRRSSKTENAHEKNLEKLIKPLCVGVKELHGIPDGKITTRTSQLCVEKRVEQNDSHGCEAKSETSKVGDKGMELPRNMNEKSSRRRHDSALNTSLSLSEDGEFVDKEVAESMQPVPNWKFMEDAQQGLESARWLSQMSTTDGSGILVAGAKSF